MHSLVVLAAASWVIFLSAVGCSAIPLPRSEDCFDVITFTRSSVRGEPIKPVKDILLELLEAIESNDPSDVGNNLQTAYHDNDADVLESPYPTQSSEQPLDGAATDSAPSKILVSPPSMRIWSERCRTFSADYSSSYDRKCATPHDHRTCNHNHDHSTKEDGLHASIIYLEGPDQAEFLNPGAVVGLIIIAIAVLVGLVDLVEGIRERHHNQQAAMQTAMCTADEKAPIDIKEHNYDIDTDYEEMLVP